MTIKSILRRFTIIILFVIPFFPIIVVDSFFFPFITGKAFYFRILVEFAFAGWVLLAFLDAKYRPKLNPITIAVTIFAIVTLAADLLGANPIRSFWSNFERMEGWLVIFHLWMFFIAITYTFGSGEEGKKMWHRWFVSSLIAATYVAGRGALQWAGKIAIEQSASRPDSTLGNTAYLAVYMLIHSFIAIYMFLSVRARLAASKASSAASTFSEKISQFFTSSQWVYVVLAIFFAGILYSTATRGAIIGYVGGLLLTLILFAIFGGSDISSNNNSNIWRWISGGIIALVVLLGLAIWLNRANPVIANNQTLGRLTSISLSEFKTEGRAYIWPMALKGFTQRPILGWGQENFNYIFNANYNPGMWGQEQWFDRAHSVFLDWLVASGLIGLITYLSLYILFLVVLWKSKLSVAMKTVFTGLMAGYAINNIFVFDNLASYVSFFALLGFGAFLSIHHSHSVVDAHSHKASVSSKTFSLDAITYIIAPVIVVFLVIGVYFLNIIPLQANTTLINALQDCQSSKPSVSSLQAALDVGSPLANQEIREQILSCAPSIIGGQYPNATKQDFMTLALKVIDDQIAATPKDARIYTLGGSFLTSTRQFDKALPMLEKAHALSPLKQSIDFDLVSTYINLGKTDEAVTLLKNAYESAKDDSQTKVAYAATLVIAGREAEAHTMFGDDPSVFENNIMAQVYTSLRQTDKAMAIYQKLADDSPKDANARLQLAQAQYTAKMIDKAIVTLQGIAKDFPDYTDQANQAIKQLQKEQTK